MYHNAHLVSNSVGPFFLGVCLVGVFLSLVVFFSTGLFFFFFFNLMVFLFDVAVWGKDVCMECISGYHNLFVDFGFKLGFVIFVGTEVMFFFSIFWFFFDVIYVNGSMWWPIAGSLDWSGFPFLGTLVLLSSGITSTWVHNSVFCGYSGLGGLVLTVVLGVFFLCIQVYEYGHLYFNISDGWVGSVFFFSTGFHGLHVFFGVVFLVFCLIRLKMFLFFGCDCYFLEAGIIYWHFVDVVWLILFLVVYM